MQTWWFLSYFSSPLSLVAQAIIPKDLVKNDKKRIKSMIKLLLQLTLIISVSVCMVNSILILLMPSTFTVDVAIQNIIKNVILQSNINLFLICFATVSDGIFISLNYINEYLYASILSTVMSWMYYIFSIRNRLGIVGVWNGLFVFSIVRMMYYLFNYKKLWTSLNFNKNNNSNDKNNETNDKNKRNIH